MLVGARGIFFESCCGVHFYECIHSIAAILHSKECSLQHEDLFHKDSCTFVYLHLLCTK